MCNIQAFNAFSFHLFPSFPHYFSLNNSFLRARIRVRNTDPLWSGAFLISGSGIYISESRILDPTYISESLVAIFLEKTNIYNLPPFQPPVVSHLTLRTFNCYFPVKQMTFIDGNDVAHHPDGGHDGARRSSPPINPQNAYRAVLWQAIKNMEAGGDHSSPHCIQVRCCESDPEFLGYWLIGWLIDRLIDWADFLLIFKRAETSVYNIGKFVLLKVPSSQIGSAWEWYHWIGLEKDINRFRFLIFWF